MTKGELEYAIRMALNNFDQWVDATGVFTKGTGYYFECQGVIEDAVKIGAIVATFGIAGVKKGLEELSEVIKKEDEEINKFIIDFIEGE
jgi:hypothetical protein